MQSAESNDERLLRESVMAAAFRTGGFGILEMRGAEALDFLHRMSTNDLRPMAPGDLVWTLLTTEKGRLIDMLAVGREEGRLLLACSEDNEGFVIDWLAKYVITEDIQFRVLTAEFSRSCLYGPNLSSAISSLLGISVKPTAPALVHRGDVLCLFSPDRWGGVAFVARGREGGSAEDALEKCGIRYISEDASETWRITRGIPRIRHEIDQAFTPYDVGLKDAISYSKGCYVGQEVIARLDTYQKVRKALFGIQSDEPLSSHVRQPVFIEGRESGILTSGSRMPMEGRYLGLAVLSLESEARSTHLTIGPPGDDISAVAVNLPMDLAGL